MPLAPDVNVVRFTGIKPSPLQLWLILAALLTFAGGSLRADGIALSRDGVNWFPGAGTYGKGWGNVGKGISVEAGGTLYVKYYSETRTGVALSYAAHGTPWGSWSTTGPVLTGNLGAGAANPIILKFSHVGTPRSSATWINGSGAWRGLMAPGFYDLALHHESLWTRPPIAIMSPPASGLGWRALFGSFWPGDGGSETKTVLVSDSGGTGMLLGVALVSLVLLGRILRRRRLRRQHAAEGRRG